MVTLVTGGLTYAGAWTHTLAGLLVCGYGVWCDTNTAPSAHSSLMDPYSSWLTNLSQHIGTMDHIPLGTDHKSQIVTTLEEHPSIASVMGSDAAMGQVTLMRKLWITL